MKVQELRQLLNDADKEVLVKAFVESYKQIPKIKKEDTDQMIRDILAGKEKEAKKQPEAVDFGELEQQIGEFLVNARAQNYFVPNRIIPKNQRPKWRFLVKGYIKELDRITPEDANCARAGRLLLDLYRLICEACNCYLFSTEDPFRSIGWDQSEFFSVVVRKIFATGYTREKISELLNCATTGGLDRESLHIHQEMMLLDELKGSDMKQMAAEEARKLVESKSVQPDKGKRSSYYEYEVSEAVNNLCDMYLMLMVQLYEPEQGIKYYFEHYKGTSREITLFRALRVADWMEEDELWLKIYKYGLAKKIKPRQDLQAQYRERTGKSSY